MRSNRCLDPKRYFPQYLSMSFRSSFVRGGAFGRLSLEGLGAHLPDDTGMSTAAPF
ncbi:MAG TPA: hypothetical protein PKO24_04385 [Methanomassiliicoccales archaeon]|nr:hypothetical protein [Methanomassiliicoccales archaeon]HOO04579.1 hypothetical protein [Methanomassiliicoccales archaeon]HQM67297.1 hypothetical protein [Methanomassiliicoccales archaeon]